MVDVLMNDQIRREIRAQLARRGLTQAEFAEGLPISEHQFSRMMAGSSEGSPKVWREVLDNLGLELRAISKEPGS